MGTKTLMSVEEYLHTTFDGADREYLDGEVVERNMGNKSHSKAQGNFIFKLKEFARTHGFCVLPEMRHQVTSSHFRIPDIAVYAVEPDCEVPSAPPLVAIEVLSPDDRIGYILPKLQEYEHWGVQHIWLADPEETAFFIYNNGSLNSVESLNLPEYNVILKKQDIF